MPHRTLHRIALTIPLLVCPSAMAWNGTGHEAVAQVAWDQLTAAERRAAVAILQAHPRYEKDLMPHLESGEDPGEHAFREAATWPDVVKTPTNPLERTEDHHNWHYVDYPYDRDGKDGPLPAETWDGHSVPENLLQAMQKVTAELRDPAAAPARRAIDLCWVLHLVGDVHQPLHAVSLYSNLYPTGDQGGNLLRVHTDFNPAAALHGVWDGVEGRSFEPDAIHKIAARVEHEHPRSELAPQLAEGDDVRAWARDSFAIAKADVYLNGKLAGATRDQTDANPDAAPPLPVGYERHAHDVADRQVALAGDRLADLLRPVLDGRPAAAVTTRPTTAPSATNPSAGGPSAGSPSAAHPSAADVK